MGYIILIIIVALLAITVLAVVAIAKSKTDPKLIEMAEVYHMPFGARLRYLYLPAFHGKTGGYGASRSVGNGIADACSSTNERTDR
jgi:hypothetical protein